MKLPRGLATSDIAAIWRITPATVYWLANVHEWRRYRSHGRVFYHPQDVSRTLENRRGSPRDDKPPAEPVLPDSTLS